MKYIYPLLLKKMPWIPLLSYLCLLAVQLSCTSALKCRRTILNAYYQADYFTSPGFPFGYPNGMDCEWILKAPEGRQVEIIFIEVLTESCCDIIELRDGNSSSAGLLATYRGNVTESIYISSFGSLYVRFRTDESYVHYGFLAEYRIATTRSENCTQNFKAKPEPTALQSPGWPIQYENNLHCTWTIKAPRDKSVSVTFLETDTERCCDYVLIRYGDSMNSKLYELGGFIGPLIQPKYISPGNILQVVFRSDSTMMRKGFSASFRAVDRVKDSRNKLSDREKCGGKLIVPQHGHGTFTTPRYPMKHANDLKCVWILVAPPSYRIMLWFTSVSTEACCDFVKIRDGESPTSRKLGVLSGQGIMFASYVSTSNKLRVDFESDLTTASRGFRAVFEILRDSTKEPCGGVRRASKARRKYISSPNWPSSPSVPKCEWRITGPIGCSIVFQVIGFHTNRYRDEIMFYDGASPSPFAIMGGNRARGNSRFYSSSNTMIVVFKPDFTTAEGGFRAYYKAVPRRETSPRTMAQAETTAGSRP